MDARNSMSKEGLDDLVTPEIIGCLGLENILSALVSVVLLNCIYSKMAHPTF